MHFIERKTKQNTHQSEEKENNKKAKHSLLVMESKCFVCDLNEIRFWWNNKDLLLWHSLSKWHLATFNAFPKHIISTSRYTIQYSVVYSICTYIYSVFQFVCMCLCIWDRVFVRLIMVSLSPLCLGQVIFSYSLIHKQHHCFKLTVICWVCSAESHSFSSVSFWLLMILTHFHSDVIVETKKEKYSKEIRYRTFQMFQ